MQVSGITGTHFTSAAKPIKISAYDMAEAARRIESFDVDEMHLPDQKETSLIVADAVDKKLAQSEKGRKLKEYIATGAAFMATVLSFKKIGAPAMRNAVGKTTAKIAEKFGTEIAGSPAAKETLKRVAKNGTALAEGGKEIADKNIGKFLKRIGADTPGKILDLAVASTIAFFTSREVGDIADERQKDKAISGAVKTMFGILAPESDLTAAVMVMPSVHHSKKAAKDPSEDNHYNQVEFVNEDGTVDYVDEADIIDADFREVPIDDYEYVDSDLDLDNDDAA